MTRKTTVYTIHACVSACVCARAMSVSPEETYDAFVSSTLSHLQRGLALDGTKKKQKVSDALSTITGPSAAERVLASRFALGKDDAAYLQSGLAVLWTTATKASDGTGEDETLAPAGLYAPDAIDGIRTGLVQALKRRGKRLLDDAPARLASVASALKVLVQVDKLRTQALDGKPDVSEKLDKFLERVSAGSTGSSKLKEDAERLVGMLERLVVAMRVNSDVAEAILKQMREQSDTLRSNAKTIERQDQKLEEQKKELENQKGRVYRLQQSLDASTKNANALAANLRGVEQQKRNIQYELTDANTKITQLSSNLESKQAELDKANADIAQLNNNLASKQAEVDKCEAEKSDLQEQLKNEEVNRTRLLKELQDCNQALDEAKAEAKAEAARLNNNLASKQAEVDKCEADKSDLQEQLKNVETNSARLLKELQDCNATIEDLSAHLKDYKEKEAAQKTTIDELEAKLKAVAGIATEVTDALEATTAKSEAREAKHAKEIEDLKAECAAELKTLKTKIAKAEAAEASMQKAIMESATTRMETDIRERFWPAFFKKRDSALVLELPTPAASGEAETIVTDAKTGYSAWSVGSDVAKLIIQRAKHPFGMIKHLMLDSVSELKTRLRIPSADDADRCASWVQTLTVSGVQEGVVGSIQDFQTVARDLCATSISNGTLTVSVAYLEGKDNPSYVFAMTKELQTHWTSAFTKPILATLLSAAVSGNVSVLSWDWDADLGIIHAPVPAHVRTEWLMCNRLKTNSLSLWELMTIFTAIISSGPIAEYAAAQFQDGEAQRARGGTSAYAPEPEPPSPPSPAPPSPAPPPAPDPALRQYQNTAIAWRGFTWTGMVLRAAGERTGLVVPLPRPPPGQGATPAASVQQPWPPVWSGAPVPTAQDTEQANELLQRRGTISGVSSVINKRLGISKPPMYRGAWGINICANVAFKSVMPPPPPAMVPNPGAVQLLMARTPAVDDAADAVAHADFMPAYALRRGLCGQRAPLEPEDSTSAADALLTYALPSPAELARLAPHLKQLTEEPLSDEETAAWASSAASATASTESHARLVASAFARLENNFAIITDAQPVHAKDERKGVERAHELRWAPTKAAGVTMSTVAALEHAAARCEKVAARDDTPAAEKAVLRTAAAALKLRQMQPLYRLHEAAAYATPAAPSPLETARAAGAGMVTRPCAIVRGKLAFPHDAAVAEKPEKAETDTAHHDDAVFNAALERTGPQTAALRNKLRAERVAAGMSNVVPDVYIAPEPHELGFEPAPTGVPPPGTVDIEAAEELSDRDYSLVVWQRLLVRGLLAARLLANGAGEGMSAALGTVIDGVAVGGDEASLGGPIERREGLWTEFRRNVAISQDRLYIFVRLLGGCVGGDLNEVITMADEATIKATKAVQEQRIAITKRVSDAQAKIVETIVGAMARESKLVLDKDANNLVVINGAAREQLNALSSGESGRPFFEANAMLRNLRDGDATKGTKLSTLLASLAHVGETLQSSLESTLAPPTSASASLAELSHPSNSYFVSLRPDAAAAVRMAAERLNVELGLRGGSRHIWTWELVEGGCLALTTRFAEFTGHLLVQTRSATGVSAMYVPPQAIHTNAQQARVALEKLVSVGMIYARSVPGLSTDARGASLLEQRAEIMNAGAAVETISIGRAVSRPRSARGELVSLAGWSFIGPFSR